MASVYVCMCVASNEMDVTDLLWADGSKGTQDFTSDINDLEYIYILLEWRIFSYAATEFVNGISLTPIHICIGIYGCVCMSVQLALTDISKLANFILELFLNKIFMNGR